MAGALEKMIIKNTDSKQEFRVQFNPERYSIERATTWEEKGKQATLQFGGKVRKSITLEFFFDTYADGKDVRVEWVQKLLALMEPTVSTSAGKKRPPVLLLTWGGFNFQGVLEKLSQNFTMFAANGTPVRAVVNATFKQFSTAEEESHGNPPGDPTKTHRVKDGETLNLIAAAEYGDPTLWRVIADENQLIDPLRPAVGALLVIPALQ
jgi:contractile injection system tube protein